MFKVDKINLKDAATMLMIYPITVVSFKLFLIPLETKMTLAIMFLLMFLMWITYENKHIGLLLSLSSYAYIRLIYLISVLPINIYLNRGNYFMKALFPQGVSSLNQEIMISIETIAQKTLLYMLCIVVIYVLYIFISSDLIKKHFNLFNIITIMYFVFAWFSYVDVKSIIMLYIIGILIFNARHEKVHHVISILLISIILLNTINSLIPYELISQKIGSIAPRILILRSDYKDRDSFFNFESSMYYPNDSKLGGSVVIDSNRLVMSVTTAEDLLYLRGRVKDTYTGLSWENSDTNYKKFESQKRYGEKKFHSENLKSAFITYEGISSLSIFSPIGILEFSLDESKVRVDKDGSIYYKNGIFEENISEYRVVFTSQDSYIANTAIYTYLPESISDRTLEIAFDITKNLTTDKEKVYAIKDFLVSNYPYSLEVNGGKNYTDFVDEFLFEEMKGYCTYYATSLAVLARINGIPSRYVEGYIVSPDSYDGGKYLIKEDKAHAWTEVYIEDEGWIILDSTPLYDFDEEEIAAIKIEKEALLEIDNEKHTELTIVIKDTVTHKDANRIFISTYVYMSIIAIIILLMILIWRYRYKSIRLSNREKAIKIIYNIDEVLNANLALDKNNRFTVYHKIALYDNKIREKFARDVQIEDQKNAIIKDVTEILYNSKDVMDNDLIDLEKYLKFINKKAYSNK